MSIRALEHHLKVLRPFLKEKGVTEICINEPHVVYIEKNSQFSRHELKSLTLDHLEALAELVAEFNHKQISPEYPLLSVSLPGGERAQFVMSPACEKGKLVCAIRRHEMKNMTLEDYVNAGAFDDVKNVELSTLSESDNQLLAFYEKRQYLEFLKLAIIAKKNILISGGTGTGKTTFFNACLKFIPAHERLITVEDTREVVVTQPNAAHLLADNDLQGTAKIDMADLFKSCLRLRPDRIFLSELRGKEAFAFLRAANSGHPGSFSTVHADTPQACFDQLIFMMQQAGSVSTYEQLLSYIKSIIHVVVQLKRCPSSQRFMYVSEIYFDKAEKLKDKS